MPLIRDSKVLSEYFPNYDERQKFIKDMSGTQGKIADALSSPAAFGVMLTLPLVSWFLFPGSGRS